MKKNIVAHQFVDTIPEKIEERMLYISIDFAIIIHKCCCGCGQKVVTPLSPTDWKFIYDGDSISLLPSIGNWSFPCQSHYWISENTVKWASKWTPEQIESGRSNDRRAKRDYYASTKEQQPSLTAKKPNLLIRIWRWLLNC